MKKSEIILKKLNEFGTTSFEEKWPDYIKKLELKRTDAKVLMEIIASSDLNLITTGASIDQFAAMHAWRALGQLRATESLKTLLNSLIDEKNGEAFWYRIELPHVIKEIGAESIKPLDKFLKKRGQPWDNKMIMINGLIEIAINQPKYKKEVEEITLSLLKKYKKNDLAFNASLLNAIFKLQPYENKVVREIIDNDKFDYDFIDRDQLNKFIKDAKMYQ